MDFSRKILEFRPTGTASQYKQKKHGLRRRSRKRVWPIVPKHFAILIPLCVRAIGGSALERRQHSFETYLFQKVLSQSF